MAQPKPMYVTQFTQMRVTQFYDHTLGRVPFNGPHLAQLSTDPVWGFDKAYSLPNDPHCLSVLELKETSTYRIEGRTLVCNTDTATIKFVARITDPGQFDPALVFALACRISAEVSYALTQNRALSNDMWAMSASSLIDASIYDGAEVGSEDINSVVFEVAQRMRLSPIVNSFASGELSPRFNGSH